MIEAYKKFWINGINFSGRSTRSDYWYVVLANFLIGFIIGVIAGIVPKLEILSVLYTIAALIPGIALVIRRFHDINKSGFNYFWILVPIVGYIIILVYLWTASVDKDNKYGNRV